jgi:hypothetical protein
MPDTRDMVEADTRDFVEADTRDMVEADTRDIVEADKRAGLLRLVHRVPCLLNPRVTSVYCAVVS